MGKLAYKKASLIYCKFTHYNKHTMGKGLLTNTTKQMHQKEVARYREEAQTQSKSHFSHPTNSKSSSKSGGTKKKNSKDVYNDDDDESGESLGEEDSLSEYDNDDEVESDPEWIVDDEDEDETETAKNDVACVREVRKLLGVMHEKLNEVNETISHTYAKLEKYKKETAHLKTKVRTYETLEQERIANEVEIHKKKKKKRAERKITKELNNARMIEEVDILDNDDGGDHDEQFKHAIEQAITPSSTQSQGDVIVVGQARIDTPPPLGLVESNVDIDLTQREM
jgi:hypothetical protein